MQTAHVVAVSTIVLVIYYLILGYFVVSRSG
jgi:hypothetical protein